MCIGISEEHDNVVGLQLQLADPGGHGVPLLCGLFYDLLQAEDKLDAY
jgi:hypothetical protein